MPTDQPLSTLSTKLHRPPPRADALSRSRLIERLEAGVREGRALTLISAPAGFGKTTLVSAWLQHSQRQAAWLSLDHSDNHPIRFWRDVIAALQTLDATWGASALAMLIAPQTPPLESVVTALINDLAAAASPIVLVLIRVLLGRSTPRQTAALLVEVPRPRVLRERREQAGGQPAAVGDGHVGLDRRGASHPGDQSARARYSWRTRRWSAPN